MTTHLSDHTLPNVHHQLFKASKWHTIDPMSQLITKNSKNIIKSGPTHCRTKECLYMQNKYHKMFIAYKGYSKDKENGLRSNSSHSPLIQGGLSSSLNNWIQLSICTISSLNNWIQLSIHNISNNILERDSISWKFKPAADWVAFNSLTNKLEKPKPMFGNVFRKSILFSNIKTHCLKNR